MPKTEEQLVFEMCFILYGWEKEETKPSDILNAKYCKVLASALFAGKSTLPKGSPRRVFIQDLAASLNRKRILPSEKYEKFSQLGYEYMAAV